MRTKTIAFIVWGLAVLWFVLATTQDAKGNAEMYRTNMIISHIYVGTAFILNALRRNTD